MATKQAAANGPLSMNISGHAAGIFADMTVDGPEIGTLVLIVDRAKNLPNRKTMGKQNPYCAARLGKEAKKTETDKRGGQTPRWDQELRFTVHESPDYNQLKISVFSEDKRTDLIGEAWVNLTEVVLPGGGKSDVWQGLNCKGKYAGEVRLELTYYDTRPKPEGQAVEDIPRQEKAAPSASKVRRRPLPAGPAGTAGLVGPKGLTPATIPDATTPGRAKHGPREYKQPSMKAAAQFDSSSAAISTPGTAPAQIPQPIYGAQAAGHAHPHTVSAPMYISQHVEGQNTPAQHSYPQQYSQSPEGYALETPDFLPQLPPSSRQRTAVQEGYAPQSDSAYATSRYHSQPSQHQQDPPQLLHSHSAPLDHEQLYSQHPHVQTHRAEPPPLQHSYSAPVVPHPEDSYSQYNKYSEGQVAGPESAFSAEYEHQPLRLRRRDVPPGWHDPYEEPQHYRQPYVEDEETSSPPPPPPPAHSSSAPTVPQYDAKYDAKYDGSPHSQKPVYATTQSSTRRQYVSDQSPLQDMERRYTPSQFATPNRYPTRAQSMDPYGHSPTYDMQQSTPPSLVPGQRQSPAAGSSPASQAQRHSLAEPYYATPSRPHPLSQEIPRARSPLPPHEQHYLEQTPPNQDLPYQEYRGRDPVPLVKPRAISPSPARPGPSPHNPRSSYDIQFPVRAFESSDDSPLSTSNRQVVAANIGNRSTPIRKSVSPRPTPPGSESRTSVPFSPDSYEIHNPTSRNGAMPNNTSPYNPYQVRTGSDQRHQDQRSGPITGWDGREIDPSDHLPVDSWAPEPEKKTPTKTYGLGRDRDFGPRTKDLYMGSASHSPTAGHRLSKDTVINIRSKTAPEIEPSSRNRLQKRAAGSRDTEMEPLRERHNFNNTVPNPYEQQSFSRRFYEEGTPSHSDGPYVLQHERGYSLPAIPPKVPIQQSKELYASTTYNGEFEADALSREISSIDLDAGRRRSRPGNSPLYGSRSSAISATGGSAEPSPTHYVPVRSHRDRNTVYY